MKVFVVLFFIVAVSANFESRIAGGKKAKAGKITSFVALQIEFDTGIKGCGGLLSSANQVITAANCVFSPSEGKATNVKFAFAQRNDFKKSKIGIIDIYAHPGYDSASNKSMDDIAVITMDQSVKLSKTVTVGGLNTNDEDDYFVGKQLLVCGYGVIDNDRTKTKSLMCTTLRAVPISECTKIISAGDATTTTQTTTTVAGDTTTIATDTASSGIICAKNIDAKNVCGGDIGSPVYLNVTNVLTAVGVVSFLPDARPNARCQDGHYTVITQLGAFGDFLKNPATYTTTTAATTTSV